jgi:hypothetical protein
MVMNCIIFLEKIGSRRNFALLYNPETKTVTQGPAHPITATLGKGMRLLPSGLAVFAATPFIFYNYITNTFSVSSSVGSSSILGLTPDSKIITTNNAGPQQQIFIRIYDPVTDTVVSDIPTPKTQPTMGTSHQLFPLPNGKHLAFIGGTITDGSDPSTYYFLDSANGALEVAGIRNITTSMASGLLLPDNRICFPPGLAGGTLTFYDIKENTFKSGITLIGAQSFGYGSVMLPNGKAMLFPNQNTPVLLDFKGLELPLNYCVHPYVNLGRAGT